MQLEPPRKSQGATCTHNLEVTGMHFILHIWYDPDDSNVVLLFTVLLYTTLFMFIHVSYTESLEEIGLFIFSQFLKYSLVGI